MDKRTWRIEIAVPIEGTNKSLPLGHTTAGPLLIQSTALLLGAKRSFRMGVAGSKRISGRAAVVAVLEELPGICSLAVAAVSMIMIWIMLYKDWLQ